MVKKKWILFLLPLSMVVVMWFYAVNFIAYADFSPPQSQIRPTRRYEEGRDINKGTIEKVQFLRSTPKPVSAQLEVKASNDEKKKDLPAWMTVLSAVGLLGASQALKKENPVPITPKEEFEIMKVPRTIYANVTKMVDQTVEVVKSVPYTVYETAYKTVNKVMDVTKEVAETIVETVKEKVVQPVTEVYDKAVQKTKQVTEYVAQKFEEVSQVAKTVLDKVERTVEKVVPVVRNVTDYVTTKVEEAYQYATQVTRDVAEWVMTPVREAYEVVREIPRNVTEYITEKVKQTKEVARTVYDNVERSKVWFEDKMSTIWDEVRETKTRLVEKFEDARRWVGDTYRTVTEKVWGKTGDSVRYEDVPVYGMVAETSTSLIKRGWQWLRSTTTKWVSKVVSWTKRKIIEPVYGWVSRSYQQLAEAGHWVTDRVRRFVNETYTDIQRIPRTIVEKVRHAKEWIEKVPRTVYDTVAEWVEKTVPVVKTVYDKVKDTAYRMVEKPVQKIKQVAETVWNTATRLVDKVTPVVRQVTDYVTEKVKEVVEVPRTIYENIVNVVEKVVPVVKDVAYTAYEKAERVVDTVVEVSKEVAKTVYRQVQEKVVTPVVEAYEVAVEKFKEVKDYITQTVAVTEQVARTVYDEVKVPMKNAASTVVNKVIIPTVKAPLDILAMGAGLLVGAAENIKDTVVPLVTLGYNLITNTKQTTDNLKNYANSVKEDLPGAVVDIVNGYKDDVSSKVGDDKNTFGYGRALGYVGLDIVGFFFSGGTKNAVSVGGKVGREALEQGIKRGGLEVIEEGAEKTVKESTEELVENGKKQVTEETTEKSVKETTTTKEVTEKPVQEAAAQTTKEVADQAKKEAIEKAEKEAIQKAEKEAVEKAEKEAAEKAAKQKLIATTGKQVSVAAEEMTQTAAAKAGVSTAKGATSTIVQPVKTLGKTSDEIVDEIYDLSAKAKTKFDDTLREIAQESSGVEKTAELKSRTRAMDKVEEYLDEGKGPDSLKDVLRGTLVYDNMEQMSKGLEILSKKFKIVGIKNRVSVPETSGYRDIQIFVETGESGKKVISEIQLNVKEMLEAKNYETDKLKLPEKTRALKKQLQKTTDLAERVKIKQQIAEHVKQAQDVYEPAWEGFLERISK